LAWRYRADVLLSVVLSLVLLLLALMGLQCKRPAEGLYLNIS
jgi:hypothetical protein